VKLKAILIAVAGLLLSGSVLRAQAPEYSIEAIRYATSPGVPVAELVVNGPKDQKVDIAMVVWLIRGGGHTILFDSGFHRDTFTKEFPMQDYLHPDDAVATAGVRPEDVTDVIISHAHWDHMGGIDLFPKATVWIQHDEYRYYTGDAWQKGGNHGGIDPLDVMELVKLNTEHRLRFVEGDDAEILPGIRAYTGSRHTYDSQYLCITGHPTWVLASDNAYFYLNLTEHLASATFSDADHAANIAQQKRMAELAGSPDRVVPGHDILQFKKFPTAGRVARIK
jgi:glyoxylase-like metal-dependent hydrolase (beta-lactamase superfamily II)